MKVNEIIMEKNKWGSGFDILGKMLRSGGSKLSQVGKSGTGKAASKAVAATGIGSTINKIGNVALYVFGTEMITDFYKEYNDLAEQKRKYDSGDRTTKIFGNMESTEAEKTYNMNFNTIVGKATLTIVTMSKTPAFFWKMFGKLGKVLGWAAGGAAGAAGGMALGGVGGAAGGAVGGALLGGGVISFSANTMAFLSKLATSGLVAGGAFAVFANSSYGQEFLKNTTAAILVASVGGVARHYATMAEQAVVNFMKNNGKSSATSAGTDSASTNPTNTDKAAASTTAAKSKSNDLPPDKAKIEQQYSVYGLTVKFSRDNPKEMFINGVPVTDTEGYLMDTPLIKKFQSLANGLRTPDPLELVPRKPGKTYYSI